MFFAEDDGVAIHTLACAAREIYEKHCSKEGLKNFFAAYVKAAATGYGETQLWNMINKRRNFFKHAGERLDEETDFEDEDNSFMLLAACHDCTELCRPNQPFELKKYLLWYQMMAKGLCATIAAVLSAAASG